MLGADSPTLPTARLVRAATTLLRDEADAVLGAAEDGGYWLLGLTRPDPAPYAGITWSTARVAGETRARIAAAGLRLGELGEWYDVDDPPALARLVREVGGGGEHDAFAAPRTAALIARLGLAGRLDERAA